MPLPASAENFRSAHFRPQSSSNKIAIVWVLMGVPPFIALHVSLAMKGMVRSSKSTWRRSFSVIAIVVPRHGDHVFCVVAPALVQHALAATDGFAVNALEPNMVMAIGKQSLHVVLAKSAESLYQHIGLMKVFVMGQFIKIFENGTFGT